MWCRLEFGTVEVFYSVLAAFNIYSFVLWPLRNISHLNSLATRGWLAWPRALAASLASWLGEPRGVFTTVGKKENQRPALN